MEKVNEIVLSSQGRNLEDAFSNLAERFYSLIVITTNINPVISKTILLREKNLKLLMYSFVKKLYELAYVDAFIVYKINRLSIERVSNDYFLKGIALGDNFKNYKTIGTIKQVTDRNISIKEGNVGCNISINIIFSEK